MNLKTMLQIGVAAFTAMSVQAGPYLDYQIKYLQESSIEETNEKDKKAGNQFAALAATAAEENRPMEVGDLPANWQSASQDGRTPQYRSRLLELEAAVDAMPLTQREANAEPVARLQVCLFHARHEMSELAFLNKIDTAEYMACAEAAYAQFDLLPVPIIAVDAPLTDLTPTTVAINNDLPPANPGECYARVYTPAFYKVEKYQILQKPASSRIKIVPAVYETIEVRRLVKEASSTIMEVPAVYETVAEQVLVKEASSKITDIPATYKTIQERILVKEASTRLEEVPAVYEWIEERVIDTPAHTVWKEGGKIIEKINGTTDQAICLVEIPATYKAIKKQILKSGATTRTIAVPAKYKSVSKQVLHKAAMTKVTKVPAEFKTIKKLILKAAATTRVIEVPAEYVTEQVQKLVTPATTREIPIAAEYETVTKNRIVKPSKMEWRQVLCDVNLTAQRITQIQQALAKANYNPGISRGKLNVETMNAITKFQMDNKLGTGGITFETVRLLEGI